VVNLGCGGGEMSMLLHDLGRSMGMRMDVAGIDANQHIINFCRRRFADRPDLTFEVCDVLSEDFRNQSFDIITTTLFMHHFKDE
jgi:ubiquinone/menaquinone biosynthesis C-methylase UbiE